MPRRTTVDINARFTEYCIDATFEEVRDKKLGGWPHVYALLAMTVVLRQPLPTTTVFTIHKACAVRVMFPRSIGTPSSNTRAYTGIRYIFGIMHRARGK